MKGRPYRDQAADPCEVPRLRRREDLLPQPPYVRFRAPPVDLAPAQGGVLWSVHRDIRRGVQLVLEFRRFGFSSQAHLTASAPFRAGPPRPISGQLSETTRWRGEPSVPVSCRLSATGIRFSVIRFPPGDWAPLTVGLPGHANDEPGPRRGYRVPHARAVTGVGALCTPRTAVLIPD